MAINPLIAQQREQSPAQPKPPRIAATGQDFQIVAEESQDDGADPIELVTDYYLQKVAGVDRVSLAPVFVDADVAENAEAALRDLAAFGAFA